MNDEDRRLTPVATVGAMPVDDQQPFRLDLAEGDDGATLTAAGEIDVATAPEIEERLLAAIAGGSEVTLDLAGVTFIDSSGLRALVTARQAAADAGLAFRLAGRSAAVDRLLQVTGLDSVFGEG